jgi:hypothetical protein
MDKVNVTQKATIAFPQFSGIRCLMMPYIQGDPESIPEEYAAYWDIVGSVFLCKGDIGFITIDESMVSAGKPHRGARAKYGRALHTEAGLDPVNKTYRWGGGWGGSNLIRLDHSVRIAIASNLDYSCAVWDAKHMNTSLDGDIGYEATAYPYDKATLMKAGEVFEIGIFTPHESLPVKKDYARQFLRIVSSGVHGREEYFTVNPLLN